MPPVKGMHFFDYRFPMKQVRRRHRFALSQKFRMSDPRDLAFCRHARSYDPDTANLDWYVRLFEPKAGLLTGDITPGYARLEVPVIESLYARLPHLKVVLSVRDPVQRLWSHMSHHWRKERITASQAQDPKFVSWFLDQDSMRSCSYPSRIFENWRSILPPDRILVIQFDRLQSNPREVLEELLTFLGAGGKEHSYMRADYDGKKDQQRLKLSDEVCSMLVERFADEFTRCADLFGGASLDWSKRYTDSAAPGLVGAES